MKIGDKCEMTKDAIDNYGIEYLGVIFTVEAVATKYMPAKDFFSKGMPEGFHPGYDEAAGGDPLYDLEGLDFSLYDWEVIEI